MPGLTIDFTDEELAAVRAGAGRAETSMKRFAHDILMTRIQEEELREGYRKLREHTDTDDAAALRTLVGASAAVIAAEAGE